MSSFSLNNLKLIFFRNYQWSSKLDTIILTSSIATGTKATNTMAASTMATKGPEFLGGSFCWVNFDHYPSQENDHYIILDSRDPASIGDGLGNSWFVNFNMLAQWLSTEALSPHLITYSRTNCVTIDAVSLINSLRIFITCLFVVTGGRIVPVAIPEITFQTNFLEIILISLLEPLLLTF